MLSRKHRLRGTRDIRTLLGGGRKVENEFFTVWLSRMPQKTPRATVIVPRSVDKSAVSRNKMKRRVREALRLMIKDGFLHRDAIVRPKQGSKILLGSDVKKNLYDIINIS